MNFSVLMCIYDGDSSREFDIAVQSILQQTVPPTEVVLVVDGPVRAELRTVIMKYEQQPLFHVFWLPVNQGHGGARRAGIGHCRYDLIAIMDADDISVPDRFAKQLQCFQQDAALGVVGGNIEEFLSESGRCIGRRMVPEHNAAIYRYLRSRCPFNQMSVMFRKEQVIAAGGYLDWYCNEDYYLWIRMALQGCKFYNLPAILVRARVDERTYQRRGGWQYFCSEYKLQNFMRRHGIINFVRFFYNVFLRFCLQVVFPNTLRAYIFKKFARD